MQGKSALRRRQEEFSPFGLAASDDLHGHGSKNISMDRDVSPFQNDLQQYSFRTFAEGAATIFPLHPGRMHPCDTVSDA
jgi:hypothetical protein